MNSSKRFYQLQGSSTRAQRPLSHTSQDTTSQAVSTNYLRDSSGTSETERAQSRCENGYAHTDTVQAEDKSSTQHSPPLSSASSDDGDISGVNSQENQPRDDEIRIDNTGEDMTREDVEEQPLQQEDSSPTDSEQVVSDVSEKDKRFKRLNTNPVRGKLSEGAPACQSGSEGNAENIASTNKLKEEGDRSLETVTLDVHVHEDGPATLGSVRLTAESDDRNEVLVQGQQKHDTWTDYQANMANDDNHVPHWTQRSCIFYPRGKCRNGDICPYIHGLVPIPGYDESNHNESGSGIEHIGWSSRQQRSCKYFVNYGWCKFGERCKLSHNINNFVDNGWNSWNQMEKVDWGVDPLSNEGHASESTELLWGNTAETQWGDDNAAAPERFDYHESGSSRNGFRQSKQGNRSVKTCRYFALGTCRKTDCRFAHQRNDFIPIDRASNGTHVAQHDTWNTSSNDQKALQSKANDGWRGGNMESGRTSQVSGQICWYFTRGRCTKPNCRFFHEAYAATNSDMNWNETWESTK